MAGLLIKDFKLMKVQARSFLISFAIIGGLSMTVWEGGMQFAMSYLMIMGSSIVLSTVSYDEFDNGFSFLFTLPVTRKGYVLEKYLFMLIVSGTTYLIVILLSVLLQARNAPEQLALVLRQPDFWIPGLAVWMVALLMMAIMLPLFLKYNGEKGRLIFVGIIGAAIAAAFVAAGVYKDSPGFQEAVKKIFGGIASWCMAHLGDAGIGAVLLAMAAAFFLLSLGVSVHVMERKEF